MKQNAETHLPPLYIHVWVCESGAYLLEISFYNFIGTTWHKLNIFYIARLEILYRF